MVWGNGILSVQFVGLMCSVIWQATEERLSTSSDQGSTSCEGARPTVCELTATSETVPRDTVYRYVTSHNTLPCSDSESYSCAEACNFSIRDVNKEKGVLEVHWCAVVLFCVLCIKFVYMRDTLIRLFICVFIAEILIHIGEIWCWGVC
jgi:hypothetical protein